jgi:dethiobiotin synthetase
MTVPAVYGDVNPYAFEPAIAPHIAAMEAGCSIDLRRLDDSYERLCRQSDVIIVEGAGGWLAPLDATRTFADLAIRWRLDVILVVGLRLGCLNHALLTAEAIEARGLKLAGWVGNSVDPDFERREANTDTLRSRLAANCLGLIPYSPGSSVREVSSALLSALPE